MSQKIAFITGGNRGLGFQTALDLKDADTKVVIGSRDLAQGKSAVEKLRAAGVDADVLKFDITSSADHKAAYDYFNSRYGRLDILVNNAGIAPDNLAENVTENDFDQTIAINLKGTFFACQAAGKVMIQQKSGCIINMGSQAGFAALPTESVYCMTKAAISHLTKCLAVEWGKYNINVNAVAPTFIHTPGTEPALADPAFRQDVIDRIAALHRIGEPIEVAGAVVFLASPAASLITGHTLVIDGGWTAR